MVVKYRVRRQGMDMNDKNIKVEFIESYIKIGNSDYQWNDNHGELIRCRDCAKRYDSMRCPIALLASVLKKAKIFKYKVGDDWFCADGERRTDNEHYQAW